MKIKKKQYTNILLKKKYYEKKEAGEKLIALCHEAKMADNLQVGSWRGFALSLSFDRFEKAYILTMQGIIVLNCL